MDNENINQNIIEPTLEDKLINLQDKWTDRIHKLNEQFKTLQSLDGLLNEVYCSRQDAVDLYYGMAKVLADRNRDYKAKAANIYNAIKLGQNGLRYTNESAITLQIETKLIAEKQCIDQLSNFVNYMKDTISSIDNIIYGINNKIKIHEMLNGLKF